MLPKLKYINWQLVKAGSKQNKKTLNSHDFVDKQHDGRDPGGLSSQAKYTR